MDVSNENLNEIEAELHVCTICDLECNTENSLQYHITKNHMAKDDIDATQTIAIRLPADSFITGQYIAKFKIGKDFKGIDTPDGCHVIHVESHAELVRLTNPNDIDYTLLFTTFFRGEEIHLADVKYDSERGHLKINNYWTVAERSIENRCDVSVTPKRLEPKDFMKIELNEKHFEGLDPNLILSNLVSFRLNDGPFCKIGFNRNKLAFVSYDI